MANKTKKVLEAELKVLLKKKPLDKITITDITSGCHMNRMTFYYHFKDIYDLIEWSVMQEANKILEGNKTYQTWQQGFKNILISVKNSDVFVLNISHSISRDRLEYHLCTVTFDLLKDVLTEIAGANVHDEKSFDTICNFYKHAFVGVVLDWVDEGMKTDVDEVVENVSLMMNGNFKRAFIALREKK